MHLRNDASNAFRKLDEPPVVAAIVIERAKFDLKFTPLNAPFLAGPLARAITESSKTTSLPSQHIILSPMTNYRWNTTDFAEGYDAAAPEIHPFYAAVQDAIVAAVREHADQRGAFDYQIVDLGGGSGRLIEKLLTKLPYAQATIVDQSEPFLAIAERRLQRFADRVKFVVSRLQNNWSAKLQNKPQAIISTSAIHHLEPNEKRALYQQVFDGLAPGGLFLNGDEVRPPSDADYRHVMEWWTDLMRTNMANGRIPHIFHPAAQGWIDRNVARFGEPKKSGDDCHETAEAQLNYFRDAGFQTADVQWSQSLWSILRGVK